jgi:hypothetical protein
MEGNTAIGVRFIYIMTEHSVPAAAWHLELPPTSKRDKEKLKIRKQLQARAFSE